MLYELREYEVVPGKLTALNDRFANIALRYFKKHGIEAVGFWTEIVGASGRLTYVLRFEDMGHRERAWNSFLADEERLSDFAETERDGPLVSRITNRLMTPTAYSPMV